MGIPIALTKNPSLKTDFLFIASGYTVAMHIRHSSGIGIAALALLIATLHFMANIYFLYWSVWWFDILMHFLGGLFIGASALWLLRFEVPPGLRTRIPVFITVFAVVLTVGVLWEVFEKITGAYNAINYTLDTATDIAMDVVGMLAAYLIYKRVVWNENSQ